MNLETAVDRKTLKLQILFASKINDERLTRCNDMNKHLFDSASTRINIMRIIFSSLSN